jgi:tight adherence protein B
MKIMDYITMNIKFDNLKKRLSIHVHWVRFFGIGYVSFFLMAQIFYANTLFSGICGLIIFLLIEKYKKYLKAKRIKILRNQFCDLLYSLSASIATGRQLSAALQEAYKDLSYIYQPNTPMMEELKHMTKSIAENRESEESLLAGFAQRSGVVDIRNFVDVYLSCRVTGGDMNQVISNASQILLEKMAIEREIKVMTSQKQFEGKIISAMPVLVIVFLNIVSPGYLENLYITLAGRMIMTVALIGIAIAYILTEKITNIEG